MGRRSEPVERFTERNITPMKRNRSGKNPGRVVSRNGDLHSTAGRCTKRLCAGRHGTAGEQDCERARAEACGPGSVKHQLYRALPLAWRTITVSPCLSISAPRARPVSYTHLRAHETDSYLVCRLLL